MLKFQTNEVPAGLESYYVATADGQFQLQVDGAVPATDLEKERARLKEFRDNNVALKKRVEDLSRFEQLFQSGDFSEEKLTKRIEEQALARAAEMKAAYEGQIAELNTRLGDTSGRLEQIVLSNAVTSAAVKNGVSDTALEDVLARARTAFKVVDGALQAADGVLDTKGKPLTLDVWLTSLADKAPHLFKASGGAGSFKPTTRPTTPERKQTPVDLISAALAKR